MSSVANGRALLPEVEESSVFETAAKPTPVDEAHAIVQRHFGICGSIQVLSSERDQNFRIASGDGREFILKIANPAEAPAVSDLQTQILLHIAKVAPSLPVQRMVPTTGGTFQVIMPFEDGTRRTIRLVTCLPGLPLHSTKATAVQRAAIGRALADLTLAMSTFTHEAAKRRLLWNVSDALDIRGKLDFVSEPETSALARAALDRFETEVLPRQDGLAQQVIHCDFNPHNILVDPANHDRISGILDFGDALMAPRINDVAIAASYHLASYNASLDHAADLVRGYHAYCPLDAAEIDVLPVLIGARVAMTVAITSWRAELYPENRAYILRNASSARSALRVLSKLSAAQARGVFRAACSEV